MLQLWIMLSIFACTSVVEAEFRKSVQPILERRCQPCHFEGGKMYARLPFDRPETIVKLNTKLFTRIRDEKEKAAIEEFLRVAQASSPRTRH